MRKIISSDFYKLKKSRAFRVCAALCLVFGVVMVVAMQAGMNMARNNPADGDAAMFLAMEANAGGAWMLGNLLSMGFNTIFVGVFVAIFVSSEFNFGTMKNTLSRGADRTKVFFSKLLVNSCAALVMTCVFMAVALLTGSVIWGFDPNGIVTFSGMAGMILPQALLTIAYAALFTFISTTMRSNGGAIAVNVICVTMAGTLLSAISMLLGGKIHLDSYWLGGAAEKLATVTPASGDIVKGVIVAVCWCLAATAAGIALFRKQDVK